MLFPIKVDLPKKVDLLLLLLLSHISRVQLCTTPKTAAHQTPLSLGFSRQEHWSGLPFPSPMHESEKWRWSRSVVSNPQGPHGLQPSRLLCPWDFPGKSTGVGCHCLLRLTLLLPGLFSYRYLFTFYYSCQTSTLPGYMVVDLEFPFSDFLRVIFNCRLCLTP